MTVLAFCKRCDADTERDARLRCRACLRANARKYAKKLGGRPKEYWVKVNAKRAVYLKNYRERYKHTSRGKELRARQALVARLRRYGLSEEAYDTLFACQDGRCAICKKRIKLGRDLHVDHDHDTGAVRGLLCARCNVTLPQTTALAKAAFEYLEAACEPSSR